MCPSCDSSEELSVPACSYLAYRNQADALKLVQELLHIYQILLPDTYDGKRLALQNVD